MLHQQGDVGFPRPEGGNLDLEPVEAVVEVLAEVPGPYCFLQIPMGGNNFKDGSNLFQDHHLEAHGDHRSSSEGVS